MNLPLNFSIAMASLKVHKWRAILAMLGVFLGALAFTGVQHVSKIMVRQAEIETEKLGPNLFAVMAGSIRFRHSGKMRVSGSSRTFTMGDARAIIGGVPSVADGAPFVSTTMAVRGGGNVVNAKIVATWPQYQDIRSFYPASGRFFNWRDVNERNKVCVIGEKIAKRLFGSRDDALGEIVYLFRASFRIIGVMETKGRDVSGEDQDEYMFMPITTYMRRASNQDWISGVFLRLADGADVSMVTESATDIMRQRHSIDGGEKDDFATMSAKDAIRLQRQALDLMTTLGAITSSISFGVGGMGILSIMILVVRARRIEIGIRRAVGGRRSDIVRQFLYESGLMAGVGGAFGVMVTVVLVSVASVVADLPFVLDTGSLLVTLIGSCVLGLAAGAYPAWQAAHIEILDVLKTE